MQFRLVFFLSTILVIGSYTAGSQTNLVSNQGLETFTNCPTTLSQLGNATGWGQPTLHIGSPDYFNSCQTNTTAGVPTNTFGSTAANQGNAYSGGYTFLNSSGSYAVYREYVVATLTQSLVAGQAYIVSFQYARSTNCRYATDALGFYLSSVWPSLNASGFGALAVTPYSTNPTGNVLSSNSWSTYQDTIIASGGEQYLTIGSFTQNASGTLVTSSASINGAYMYFDDAKVIVYNGVFGDSNICLGDTGQVYSILDSSFYWVNSNNPNVSLGSNDTLNAAPTQTTTYWAITWNDTFVFTVTVHDPPSEFVGNDTVLCEGDTLNRLVNLPGYDLLWSNNDTDSLFTTVDSGYHWLEISIYTCTKRDSFHVDFHEFPEFELLDDTTICKDDSYFLESGLSTPLVFSWNTGANTPGISITDSGKYVVTVTNQYCSYSDSVVISEYPEVHVDLGTDKEFCYTSSATIIPVTTNVNQFSWSTGTTSDSIEVYQTGTYYISATYSGVCEMQDSVTYTFYDEPIVSFPNDTAWFCQNDKVELIPDVTSSINVEYLWNNTDNSPTIETNQIGLFWVEVSNDNCKTRDSIIVAMYEHIGVTLGQDRSICEGESIALKAKTNTSISDYQWSNGATGISTEVSEHGTYTITASNGICVDVDEINVFVLKYPEFSLGEDTSICPKASIELDITQDAEIIDYTWNDGFKGSKHYIELEESQLIWGRASNGDCSTTDSIYVDFRSVPSAYIGEDTTICEGDAITVSVQNDERILSSIWSSADSTLSINVSDSGILEVLLFDGYCTSQDKRKIEYRPEPGKKDFVLDVPNIICLNDEFSLDMSNELISNYLWQDGSTNPRHIISEEGIYWVEGTHRCGIIRDTAIIERCECPIWAPTAFVPNGDESNDKFSLVLDCQPLEYQLSIYDRWGELVFESSDFGNSWDGSYRGVDAPAGAYVWKLIFTVYNEGNLMKSEDSGQILLVR